MTGRESRGNTMASESHKRKGKNSYLINNGAKRDGKWKRNLYFRKRDRVKSKRIAEIEFVQ